MYNYKESKKKIDAIRHEYNTAGDVLFRTAIQVLMEQGSVNLNDEKWCADAIKSINDKHDEVEANGKVLVIGRSFEIAIIECAKKLAKIESYDLLMYIQREVWLSNEGIDHQRAMELLVGCMFWITEDLYETGDIRDAFLDEVGFEEDELEELGYGFILDTDEE